MYIYIYIYIYMVAPLPENYLCHPKTSTKCWEIHGIMRIAQTL